MRQRHYFYGMVVIGTLGFGALAFTLYRGRGLASSAALEATRESALSSVEATNVPSVRVDSGDGERGLPVPDTEVATLQSTSDEKTSDGAVVNSADPLQRAYGEFQHALTTPSSLPQYLAAYDVLVKCIVISLDSQGRSVETDPAIPVTRKDIRKGDEHFISNGRLYMFSPSEFPEFVRIRSELLAESRASNKRTVKEEAEFESMMPPDLVVAIDSRVEDVLQLAATAR